MQVSRRDFVKAVGASGAYVSLFGGLWRARTLEPAKDIENPLAYYPDRNWELIYRDQYRYDRSFTYVCSPNDTHSCRMRAFVRNDVVTRIEQNYDVSRYEDLYGNRATMNWSPRGCAKGLSFHRRVYGPYRLRYPIVRKGWKQWADDGFPYLTPESRAKYKFDSRGSDKFLKVSWDDAFRYIAKALVRIAETYSGREGAKRLEDQGYPKEMIEEMGGAGTRTFKFRGGMGLLGVMGKYGIYRLNNSMALLDQRVRGVKADEARGGRNWSNYRSTSIRGRLSAK